MSADRQLAFVPINKDVSDRPVLDNHQSMPDQFSIKYAQLRAQLDKLEVMDSKLEKRQENLLIKLQKIQDDDAERQRQDCYHQELLSAGTSTAGFLNIFIEL